MCARSLFQHITASIGVVSNILLICLITLKSPKTIGSYKILMIYISIFEILYAILDALVVPKMWSQGSGALIFIFSNQAFLPDSFLLYANVLYCTFFGTSMAVFSVHFIYRYLAVSGSHFIKDHNRKVIVFLLLFPIVFGILWYFLSYFTLGPFEGGDFFVRKYYIVDQPLQLSDIYYVGFYFYPEDSFGNTVVNWKCLIGCSTQTFFINVSFGLIFYFGIKCHRHTKMLANKSTKSSVHVALQTQIFYALVFQTVIPVLLMHIPSTVGISMAFLNISTESWSNVLNCTISLYPALDPLPNFFIIKSYRRAFIDTGNNILDIILCRRSVPRNVIQVQSKNILMSTTSKI